MDESLASLEPNEQDPQKRQELLDSLPDQQKQAVKKQLEMFNESMGFPLDRELSYTLRPASSGKVEVILPDETASMVEVDGESWISIDSGGIHYDGPDDGGYQP